MFSLPPRKLKQTNYGRLCPHFPFRSLPPPFPSRAFRDDFYRKSSPKLVRREPHKFRSKKTILIKNDLQDFAFELLSSKIVNQYCVGGARNNKRAPIIAGTRQTRKPTTMHRQQHKIDLNARSKTPLTKGCIIKPFFN